MNDFDPNTDGDGEHLAQWAAQQRAFDAAEAQQATGAALRVSLRKVPYRIGVHVTHCCALHGCKYGDADCPVSAGQVAQEYPCEHCPEEPATPADRASADELLHHLRECVASLEGPLRSFQAMAPVLARQVAAMRASMDELDRKLTYGHPLPGDWKARRSD